MRGRRIFTVWVEGQYYAQKATVKAASFIVISTELSLIGRTGNEAETPILWPPDAKSQLIGKDLTHWKKPCCWERLRAGGEGDDRG